MKKFIFHFIMTGFILMLSFFALFAGCATTGLNDKIQTSEGEIIIHPLSHSSFVLKTEKTTIIFDPVGDSDQYTNIKNPDYIIITHTHPDHFNTGILKDIKGKNTKIIGPKVAGDQYPGMIIMNNGEKKSFEDMTIEAIPMYNLTKERLMFHPRGVGNGYVVTINGKRIYNSGDTEDIPEMRKLKNIDIAFVCMNLPYTMDVNQAASAVLDFKPKIIYPFHYREGGGTFSNIKLFKQHVSKTKGLMFDS